MEKRKLGHDTPAGTDLPRGLTVLESREPRDPLFLAPSTEWKCPAAWNYSGGSWREAAAFFIILGNWDFVWLRPSEGLPPLKCFPGWECFSEPLVFFSWFIKFLDCFKSENINNGGRRVFILKAEPRQCSRCSYIYSMQLIKHCSRIVWNLGYHIQQEGKPRKGLQLLDIMVRTWHRIS